MSQIESNTAQLSSKAFFAEVFRCSRALNTSNTLSLDRLANHINSFWKNAQSQLSLSRWHAGAMVAVAGATALLSTTAAFVPKVPVKKPILGPQPGIMGWMNHAVAQVGLQNLVRTAFKSSATFGNAISAPMQTLFQGSETELANKTQMIQSVLIGGEQSFQSSVRDSIRELFSSLTAIQQKLQDSK